MSLTLYRVMLNCARLSLFAILLFASIGKSCFAVSLTGDYFTHDPSRIIQCDGKYYLYCTGTNIEMRYSTDMVKWTVGPSVLNGVPAWAQQMVPGNTNNLVWAPDVIFISGKYFLFYAFSTWGGKTSVIGLVTNPTLDPARPDYHWTDQGLVVASNDGADYNAIDPCPVLDASGNLWMSFGSWNSEHGGIELVKLSALTGKPVSSPIALAQKEESGPEASYVEYHAGYYYLFENEGTCCNGMSSTYHILMGRSTSITGPYIDKTGVSMLRGGGTLFLNATGPMFGPGCVGIYHAVSGDVITFHYYSGDGTGRPTLAEEKLAWSADGWPRAVFNDNVNTASVIPPGHYYIFSKSSRLSLSLTPGDSGDGASLRQEPFSYDGTHAWNINAIGDGYYSMSSLASGEFVDLFQCDGSDGARIDQYPWYNDDCQRWLIQKNSDGSYRIVSKSSGGLLTVPDSVTAPGAPIELFTKDGDTDQSWLLIPEIIPHAH